jgi:hypothetical protein
MSQSPQAWQTSDSLISGIAVDMIESQSPQSGATFRTEQKGSSSGHGKSLNPLKAGQPPDAILCRRGLLTTPGSIPQSGANLPDKIDKKKKYTLIASQTPQSGQPSGQHCKLNQTIRRRVSIPSKRGNLRRRMSMFIILMTISLNPSKRATFRT